MLLDDGYPWEQHDRAVHHLSRLELREAREALDAMTPALRGLTADRTHVGSYLVFDLLCQLRAALGLDGRTGPTARSERWAEARAFSAVDEGPALAAIFQAAVADALQPYRGAPANPLVARARAYIEQNHARKLSLRHVAEFLNVSRNYLSSLFRKESGCTITEYIHQIRLRRAEALLLGGAHTVSEIAYQVGYQNYRDFYRNFVKYVNSSPTRFRRVRAEPPAPPG